MYKPFRSFCNICREGQVELLSQFSIPLFIQPSTVMRNKSASSYTSTRSVHSLPLWAIGVGKTKNSFEGSLRNKAEWM